MVRIGRVGKEIETDQNLLYENNFNRRKKSHFSYSYHLLVLKCLIFLYIGRNDKIL